ncbi:DUF6491 family protein [Phenylobacterium sp.]|jgi:hypothetical protein|uniref:DUF6491 family protein n=1 Tax=Phenylobacterium sp. TaxID=1871053 RepID=UPI002F91FC56
MKLALFALAGAATALAACADYPPPPPGAVAVAPPPASAVVPGQLAPGQCFRTSDIRNHTIGDDHTLFLDVRGRDVYQVTMHGSCLAGATSSDPLVMRQPPGSHIACRPIDLDISISRGGGPATPCIVDTMIRLTPEQVASLPPRVRP